MAILAVGLVVTMADVPLAWVVWPLGYGVVLPLAVVYAKRRERTSSTRSETRRTDPLAESKRRYVEGDIGEAEFEREVEATLSREESP
jgi:uncharacterized membrane protein